MQTGRCPAVPGIRRDNPPSHRETVMAEEMTKVTSGTLIAAEKVEGTDVYNLQGEKLGTVEDIMIDKVSGKAIYAIMSFGGFLGIGEKYHPLPWSTLNYDEPKGGYVVNLDKKMLENAPSYDMDEDFIWTPEYGRLADKASSLPSASSNMCRSRSSTRRPMRTRVAAAGGCVPLVRRNTLLMRARSSRGSNGLGR